ncbi:MAG: STAS domain-containing protein [Nitrospirales bacterium]|nr:STAS domain-containing protein [Nitrospira sp.]MDR4501103.1 STAS domain-containing protein [Nitrospirales bacterium]
MEASLTIEKDRVILKLWGRFDVKWRQEFLTAFSQAKDENTEEIVVDLREVPFIDSTALGLLMVAHNQCKTSSRTLRLCVSHGHVKRTLEQMKISELVSMVLTI